jgi:hypothetical protein
MLRGHNAASRGMYVALGIALLLTLWFSLAKLVTEVRETALSIRFFLLSPERIIAWREIRRAEAVTYATSYGGWGVRWGPRGMAYTVMGNRGVRIELRNGNDLIIGSRRAYELAKAIGERVNQGGEDY